MFNESASRWNFCGLSPDYLRADTLPPNSPRRLLISPVRGVAAMALRVIVQGFVVPATPSHLVADGTE